MANEVKAETRRNGEGNQSGEGWRRKPLDLEFLRSTNINIPTIRHKIDSHFF